MEAVFLPKAVCLILAQGLLVVVEIDGLEIPQHFEGKVELLLVEVCRSIEHPDYGVEFIQHSQGLFGFISDRAFFSRFVGFLRVSEELQRIPLLAVLRGALGGGSFDAASWGFLLDFYSQFLLRRVV